MEYIETNGRQFIDTGVIGKAGTKCEFDFAWLANDTSTLIGVATNSAGHGFVPFAGQCRRCLLLLCQWQYRIAQYRRTHGQRLVA